jgi:carbonic anhydrase
VYYGAVFEINWEISNESLREESSVSPHSFCRTVLFASILSLVGLPAFSAAQEAHPPHWAYSGPEGSLHWGTLDASYAECSLGHKQSPIDITHAQPSDLPSLKLDYKAVPLNIIDNGHTIQVNYAPGSTLTVGDKTYTLKQFHFHHPSEEHVNGKGFPLVAHLVHADADGNLAVIAVLFEQGNSNPLIETLWRSIPSEKEKAMDIPAVSIQVKDMLPKALGYFTYAGSLTTPPCSEGVTWYVLTSHVTVSPEQVAAFSKIYPMNARPIQPTNGREILRSK